VHIVSENTETIEIVLPVECINANELSAKSATNPTLGKESTRVSFTGIGEKLRVLIDGREAELLEVLYLAYSGRKVRVRRGSELTIFDFNELVLFLYKYDSQIWDKFVVYLDLRNRGRPSIGGPYPNSLLVRSKSSGFHNLAVFIVNESDQLSFDLVREWIDYGKRSGRDVLLAIVDKYGDITYYSLSEITLQGK
jgi:tRNA splicing endonuclease